jgi:hypothetical protein
MSLSNTINKDKVCAIEVALNVNGIPEELKSCPQWIVWKAKSSKNRPGKMDKIPYQVTGNLASTTNPETWTTFDKALEAYQSGKEEYQGVGFVFTEETPFSGVDIDSCIKDSKIDTYAKELLVELASYTEISPSGKGLHIIAKGKKPGNRSRKAGSNVEIYSTARFFTITGNVLEGTPNAIMERQEALDKIYREMFESKKKQANPATHKAISRRSISDEEIISRAMTAANNEKFSDLWYGRWEKHFSSQSEADSALCFMLAFWTGKNAEQMDRLFKASGLYREKWDEKRGEQTYGQITLNKALNLQTEVYDPDNAGTINVDPINVKSNGVWGIDGNLIADGLVTQEELAKTESILFPRLEVHLEEDNFLMQYMSYASKMSDAYPDYHFAMGITLLSIAAMRKIHMDLSIGRIYPNIWCLLIGESTTSRKSTALGLGQKMAMEVFGFGLSDDFSPEAFVEMMASHPRTYLFKDEFAGLLASMQKAYMSDLRDLLCTLYDCKPYHRQLRTSQRNKVSSFDIKDPYLTMAGATTLTSFKEHTQSLDVTSGWLLRHLYFCPDYYKESRPFREAAYEDYCMQNELTLRLSCLRDKLIKSMWDSEEEKEYFALMSMEPEAWIYFQTWQLEREAGVALRKNKTENAIFGRLTIYALKLAMLFTLGRADFEVYQGGDAAGNEWLCTSISLDHIKEACKLIWEYFMPTERVLVEEVAANEEKNLQVKIINCLRRNGGKLRQRDLLRQLHMPLKQVGDALQGLKTSEEVSIKVESEPGKKKVTWVILKQQDRPLDTITTERVAA